MKNPWKRYSKINPQRESGNRQICNEIFHALMSGSFTGAEYKIILALIDKTWGFKKTTDAISVAQFSKMTNLSKRTVQRTLKKLNALRVVYMSPSTIRASTGSPLNNYSLNKHYDTWRVEGCQIVQGCQLGHPSKTDKGDIQGQTRVTQMTPTKETSTKETSTKESVSRETLKPPLQKPQNVPTCPHQEIITLYHELLPELPRVKEWTDPQRGYLKTRWREKPERQNLEWWKEFFLAIKASDFLMGRVKDFQANLGWTVQRSKFNNIINGQYRNHGPRTGSVQTDNNLRAAQAFMESDYE